MEQIQLFFELGLTHVLDINGYDHILFLVVLAAPYLFSSWKKILLLVTVFTLGHTVALILSTYGVVSVKSSFVEFLIPITIIITAIFNIISSGKTLPQTKLGVLFFITLFFGLIHGLGFSNYFRMIASASEYKALPLTFFALGVEVAQIVVVLLVLLLASVLQGVLGVSKKNWVLVVSSIMLGMALTMVLK